MLVAQSVFGSKRTNFHGKYDHPQTGLRVRPQHALVVQAGELRAPSGARLKLTEKETAILARLARAHGATVSRAALLRAEVQHFAFPYGDRISAGSRESEFCRKMGFRSAVTTESNTIFAADRDRLFSLPRLTFNGLYQNAPLLDLLLSGTLPLLRRGLNVRAGSTRVMASRPTVHSSAARR